MYVTKPVTSEMPAPLAEVLDNLEKFTKYSIHVQAYNTQGAGPRSDDVTALTLEDGKGITGPLRLLMTLIKK